MQLNSIFPRVSGRIVSVKLVWIRGNPGFKREAELQQNVVMNGHSESKNAGAKK